MQVAQGVKMLTQDILKKRLNYNEKTGVFTWKVNKRTNEVKDGDIAGWDHKGYVRIKIGEKNYFAHRLAWLYINGRFPNDCIDHINHNKKDNRIENIREVTHQQNHMNEPIQANNKSGRVGVYWDNEFDKWRANIRVNGKCIHLGRFKGKQDAILARAEAELKHGFHANHGT